MPDEPVNPRPLVSGPSPEEVAGRAFPSARRGLDPEAVRRYLGEIAASLRDAQRREEELRRQLQDAEQRRQQEQQQHVDVPLDEATLTAALGAETGRVLQAAHEAARDIVSKAERRANALLTDAESALAERTRYAEHEASEMLGRAHTEATAFLETTRDQARTMVDEARDARRRILTDLTERRRALHFQIEQLRAGKDSLTEVLNGISGSIVASIDAVRARLDGAEDQARLAASDARRDTTASGADDLAIDDLADINPPELDVELSVSMPEPPVFSTVEPDLEPPSSPSASAEFAPDAVESPAPEESALAAPVAETEVEVEVGEENEPPRGIDELFARIRASRQQEVAEARAAMEAADRATMPFVPPPDIPASDVIGTDEPPATEDAAPTDAPDAPPPTRSRRSAGGTGRDKPAPSQAAVVTAPRSAVLQTDIVGDEFQLLVRRDQLLGPSIAELGRALKRTLRIEQNDLLDAMRNLKPSDNAAAHLPGNAMVLRVAASTTRGLEAAWLAGETFVGDLLGGGAPALLQDAGARDEELAEVSRLLALEIVDPIRRGLEARLTRTSDEEGAAGSAVGAAFREWKGSKVEGLAGDYASRAFARAAIQACRTRGASVTWLVDDGDQRCPDCDDNALAGAVVAGTAFPTGHVHPPIHPGCRCIVVPAKR